jgi:hypothetical protein
MDVVAIAQRLPRGWRALVFLPAAVSEAENPARRPPQHQKGC